jgi:exodeoxyribonuclease VII large subunit
MGPRILTGFMAGEHKRLTDLAGRLGPALLRARTDAKRQNAQGRDRLAGLSDRLDHAPRQRLKALEDRLDRLDRMRQTLGYTETLKRGYAVVRGAEGLVTSAEAAAGQAALEIQFHDGRVAVRPESAPAAPPSAAPASAAPSATPNTKPRKKTPPPEQGSLF